jgi:hypothetical protein
LGGLRTFALPLVGLLVSRVSEPPYIASSFLVLSGTYFSLCANTDEMLKNASLLFHRIRLHVGHVICVDGCPLHQTWRSEWILCQTAALAGTEEHFGFHRSFMNLQRYNNVETRRSCAAEVLEERSRSSKTGRTTVQVEPRVKERPERFSGW